nr:MAG TPA: hypothetical protein [Caudoviricetes sp.]
MRTLHLHILLNDYYDKQYNLKTNAIHNHKY